MSESRARGHLIVLRLLAVGLAGGGILELVGFPLGALIGALIASGVAIRKGMEARAMPKLRTFMLLSLGIFCGERFSPDSLESVARWPVTLAVALSALVALLIFGKYLGKAFGWSKDTSVLAAIPGLTSVVALVADQRKACLPSIMICHALRFHILVLSAPLVILIVGENVETPKFAVDHGPLIGSVNFLAHFLIAWIPARFLDRKGLPGGPIIAGLAVSLISHGSGLSNAASPHSLFLFTNVAAGVLLGFNFSRIKNLPVLALLRAAAAFVALTLAVTILFSALAQALTGIGFIPILLAFAPGGFEAMILISVAIDANPTFVLTHQLIRLVAIVFLMPLLLGKPHPPPDLPAPRP